MGLGIVAVVLVYQHRPRPAVQSTKVEPPAIVEPVTVTPTAAPVPPPTAVMPSPPLTIGTPVIEIAEAVDAGARPPTVRGGGGRRAAPPPKPISSSSTEECTWYDSSGVKHYRPQCLQK
jgi:hypothetical protein